MSLLPLLDRLEQESPRHSEIRALREILKAGRLAEQLQQKLIRPDLQRHGRTFKPETWRRRVAA